MLGQVEFAVDTKVIWNTSVSNLVVGREDESDHTMASNFTVMCKECLLAISVC